MARFTQTVVSSSAIAGNTAFANLVSGASANYKLRRLVLGCVAGAAVPTSQQVEVAVFRATARGSQSTTATGLALDGRSQSSNIVGLDTAWTTNPTLAAAPQARLSFNTQSGMDIPAEQLEEWVCDQGANGVNGFALQNVANALPAGHQITATLEWEE